MYDMPNPLHAPITAANYHTIILLLYTCDVPAWSSGYASRCKYCYDYGVCIIPYYTVYRVTDIVRTYVYKSLYYAHHRRKRHYIHNILYLAARRSRRQDLNLRHAVHYNHGSACSVSGCVCSIGRNPGRHPSRPMPTRLLG